ncbi:MAG: lamin tail domain-containing protein [Candidatus Cloacimonetes bacterium]|nr:lamin tail domain-containing protein [Candidatus Cloacimonadota bacterium]
MYFISKTLTKCFLFLAFFNFYMFCFAYDMPLINEIMYDPIGADTGKEWIEIYNPSMYPYSLYNWTIQTAGTSFQINFTFPDTIIEPGAYILIGENEIEQADYIINLDLQNGGSATDGVRLVSADSSYTDTILYDSPNSNQLPDDINNPAIAFAQAVPAGYSLARNPNGYDNNSISDWQASQYPTPKKTNFLYYDLEIKDLSVSYSENNCILAIVIHDLSTSIVDSLSTHILIKYNKNTIFNNTANLIFDNKIAIFEYSFIIPENSLNIIEAEISYTQDVDNSNNYMETSFFNGRNPLIINEIQFQPLSDEPEWIEFFNRSDYIFQIDNAYIQDQAEGKASFSAIVAPGDYLLLTQDTEKLMEKHYNLDSTKVIQPTNWVTLNNSSDTIELYLTEQVKLDSVFYEGQYSMRGYSLERTLSNDDENYGWEYSLTEIGSTPLEKNSNTPNETNILIKNTEIINNENTLNHIILIENCGIINPIDATIKISHKTESDINFNTLEILDFVLDTEKELNIASVIPTKTGYHFYKYDLLIEEQIFSSMKNSFLNNNPPIIINEIMFNPNSGEPEWIEFFQNRIIDYNQEFLFFTDNDSIKIPCWQGDFALITATGNDSIFMRENYNIPLSVPIFTGLKNLNNTGELLIFKDYDKNIFESFPYYSDWSFEKGVSTERISVILNPSSQNWTPSLQQSTPGQINSVNMNIIPTNNSFVIENNPFSPYRNEHCIIHIKVPQQKVKTKINIYDLKGRKIKLLADNIISSGNYTYLWNGTNDANKKLLPGAYPILVTVKELSGKTIFEKKKLIYIGH